MIFARPENELIETNRRDQIPLFQYIVDKTCQKR